MRHPTREAIDKFNRVLNLKEDPSMQDWEVECADPNRIEEFLICYKNLADTAEERFTLMALILGSFEEYHGREVPAPKIWKEVKDILSSEYELHEDHIEYYSCWGSNIEDEWFPITPLMRTVRPRTRPA